MMKNAFLAMVLAASLCAGLAAEPVYVRNKPFKGPASGNGAAMMVGLKEIAEALELHVVEKNGGFLVDSEEGEPKDGEVLVFGKAVTSAPGEAGITVNLKEFAEAAGLVYRPNKSMGTIDISKGPAKGAKPSTGAAATGSPGIATVINQKPGTYVDVRSLVVRGSYTAILLYKDGEKDSGYKQVFSEVDGFLKNPEFVLYKVNIGFPGSPMWESLPWNRTPQLLIFDKAGVLKRAFNGHSILGSVPRALDDIKNLAPLPWSQH